MKKDINKILLFTSFIGLAFGMLYNFQELWLSTNGISSKSIGIVYGLGSFACVPAIYLFANFLTQKRLKKVVSTLLMLIIIASFTCYFLNNLGYIKIIKLLTVLNYILYIEVLVCIYPLLCIVKKDDKLFAKKEIVLLLFNYFGMLITAILLNKTVLNKIINYNTFVLWSMINAFIALVILLSIDFTSYYGKEENNKNNLLPIIFKKVKKDKISIIYLLYSFCGMLSIKVLYGLMITILTKGFNFSEQYASIIRFSCGIGASLLASFVLSFLTFKNNYINISIKLLIRVILFTISLITGNYIITLMAFLYPLISDQSYLHVTDAPYVNRLSKDEQIAFINIKDMSRYLGEAIGVYLCGVCLLIGIKVNLTISLIVCIIQLMLGIMGIYLIRKEKIK